MKVIKKRLDDLKHPEKNVRIHSEQQIRELKRSLEKFGQTRALVVDENNVILIGNGSSEENRTLIWLPCIGTARCSAEVPEKGKRRKRDRSREIIGRS